MTKVLSYFRISVYCTFLCILEIKIGTVLLTKLSHKPIPYMGYVTIVHRRAGDKINFKPYSNFAHQLFWPMLYANCFEYLDYKSIYLHSYSNKLHRQNYISTNPEDDFVLITWWCECISNKAVVFHKETGLVKKWLESWWRHQIETFSALLALCTGNSPVTGEFPTQMPVPQSFDAFFDLCLNERLSKQL